jgi:hypothetical protein
MLKRYRAAGHTVQCKLPADAAGTALRGVIPGFANMSVFNDLQMLHAARPFAPSSPQASKAVAATTDFRQTSTR